MKNRLSLLYIMLFALIIGACSASSNTENTVVGIAPVDTVNVMMLQSLPTQVQVVASGVLPDACTEIGETNVQQDGNRFEIEMLTHSELNQTCAQVLAPYEETIPLDVAGLAEGEYLVEVNGITDSFTYDTNNTVAPGEPVTTEVAWEEASALILNGQVSEITQFHSLEVRMLLRDGNIVTTTEPEIDEVFRLIDECGLPCSDVLVATE